MKVLITCKHCSKMNSIEKGHLHICFATGEIVCCCPNCKKENKMKFEPKQPKLPRIGISRR